jgi:hypothetical protein
VEPLALCQLVEEEATPVSALVSMQALFVRAQAVYDNLPNGIETALEEAELFNIEHSLQDAPQQMWLM